MRNTILAFAFVLAFLAAASPALALNTAVWSGASPAAGALALVKPTAPVVVADDTAAITKATMTMNGYAATFVNVDFFVGHSYYDEEAESDVWMVDDWTKARLTGYFPANRIVTGTNTIVTTVTSSKGVSTYSRTFTYGAVTMITLVSPAADSVIPASPADISASLSSGATSFTSVMSVDGVVVPTTYTAATKTFKHTPAAALGAGTHTVSFSAVDSSGGSVSKTWKFKVSPPMSNGAECTACHTGYPASHPTADCAKCHDHAYPVPGGTHGGAVPTAAGCSGDGGIGQDDACHDLDHREDGIWGVWGSGRFACADCHSATYPTVAQHTDAETTAAHVSDTTCNGTCHSMNLVAEHGKYPKTAAIKYQCTLCHAPEASQRVRDAVAAGNTACGACHDDGTGHEAVHATTVDPACAGSGCHPGSSLTGIHINSSTTLTCDSCHESTDPDVVSAISTGDKSCSACHDAQPHPNLEANHTATMTSAVMGVFDNHDGQGPVDWDVQCSMCHATTQLLTIHANDCAACHSGSAPVDSLGTWNKSCQQGACHPTVEHAQADPAHTAIASQNCETCHEPNWEVYYTTCEWCHDPAGATAPTTTSDLKANYVGSASINFSAGGVHYTRYKLDGGATAAGSSLTVQGPAVGSAMHSIEYWSVNDAGAEELPHKTGIFTITADTLAPTTTSNALAAYVGPATITLSVTDNNSSPVPLTYYKLDGGAQTAGRTIAVAPPASGAQAHTLEFWSIDAAGNVELPHKSKSFTITADTVAPTTTSDAPLYSNTSTNVRVNLSATDPAPSSGVAVTYYRVNNGSTAAGTWFYTPSTQGVHTLQYWSVDRSGNVEAMKSHTMVKDWTAPTTTSNVQASYVGSAAIHLTGTDSGPAGVDATYYKLDNDPQALGTDVTTTLTGAHTLKFWSVDKAGNVEAQKTITFTVSGGGSDTTPPITTSDALTAYPSAAVIHLSATDIGGTGVANTYYKLDGGAQTTGTVVNVAAPPSGSANHTLEFWSVDVAGNTENPHKTVSFTVSNTTAMLRLVWGDNDTSGYIPTGDSWASWTVRNGGATGPVVATGSNSAGSGWDGIDDVIVPVQAAPYYVYIDWWDADWESEGPTIHSAVYVVVPNSIMILRY